MSHDQCCVLLFGKSPASGGGSFDRVDEGALTNVQILAIAAPTSLAMAFSTDDNINYTFFGGNWYSTGGGILV